MDQDERVGSFFDRLNILLSGARTVLKEMHPTDSSDTLSRAMEPLEVAAVTSFIKRLPADIARAVNLQQPKTLEDAYTTASFMESSMDSNIIPDTRYKTHRENPCAWERQEYTAASYSPRPPRENRLYQQMQGYNAYDASTRREVAQIVTQPRILQRPRQDYQDREDNQVNQPRCGYQDPGRLFQQDERLFNPYDSRNDTRSAYHNAGPRQNFNQGHRNFHPSNKAPQNYNNNTNYARTRFNTAPRQAPSDFRPEPNFSND